MLFYILFIFNKYYIFRLSRPFHVKRGIYVNFSFFNSLFDGGWGLQM